MKGQYLAVETVFVFGLGIMVAIGVIGTFDKFKAQSLSTVESDQARLVFYKLQNSISQMTYSDVKESQIGATYKIDLPNRLAGNQYRVEIEGKKVLAMVGEDRYQHELRGLENYSISGTITGGDTTIFKEENSIKLGAD